ncbi:MAG: M43 family zinc metalloprotease [bacterium]|nr:M43 family zinc metalloprotease [bacterium]
MKRTMLSIMAVFGLISAASAQQATPNSIDPQNCRQGESVEYCRQHTYHAELLNNPAYVQSLADDDAIRAQEAANGQPETNHIMYIPVVFHLLHNNGVEHISDEQIIDAFNILNRDYMLQNADANSVVNAFNASNPQATVIPDSVNIQFRLATKAPDGTCFTGITHTVSSAAYSSNDNTRLNAIINGNDVYNGQWPGNRYLNIFIAGDIGGAAGYTYLPSNWIGTGMDNGIRILHQYVGSIGTGNAGTSRALTHEVGHWLNLPHPWGGTNNPGQAANCNDDDGIGDTPDCQGVTSCQLTANTCSGDNNYWGFDQVDNVENYMDYSYCSKMFTPDQAQQMRNALNSSIGGRSNLKSASNLALTGADGNLELCEARFSANRTSVCVGESVDFSDDSFNAVTSRTWTFQGGTPATSTAENPTVTYNTPGIYEVEMTATDGTTSLTETKTGYIRVLANGGAPPVLEGFENYNSLDNITEWQVIDYGNNAEWELTSTTGLNSSKSVVLPNFGQTTGNMDELVSEPIDLSGITSQTSMTLSFRYAYRKRNTGNDETMKVYVSNTCGETWVARKTLTGPILGSDVSSSSWAPASESDWVTVHMTNITSAYWVENFRFKFEFESDGGNNMYLDNINIYPGSPSDNLVASLTETDDIDHVTLYPNPTEGDVTVRFDVASAQEVNMEVVDVTGKVVNTSRVNANTGANMVVLGTSSMAPGMYFLKIDGSSNSLQFVVK